MQIPRPHALGDQSVVKRVREVLFSEPILGAVAVRPKGYWKILLAVPLGFWAHFLTRRATEPLPPTMLYLAVTRADIRLFSRNLGGAFEIGRWKLGSYRAAVEGRRVDLEVERLGRITMFATSNAQPVLELVERGASGPVTPRL